MKFFAFDRFRKKILEPSLPALLDFTDLSRQELIKGQTKIQGNVNRTRQVILEGQRDIKSNLEELAKGINTNNKNLADDIKSNLEKLDESITTNNINLADDIKNNLEKLAESITTNNVNLVDELILGQAKLIYISRAASNFYGTKMIWAGFGRLAILKKKDLGR